MLTDVTGVRVGHWTDSPARTGCTVVLFPAGTVASGEVRGGAPGTREWELLRPERLVSRVDAFVLAGGSAFGLAACDGVVRWCEERGVGLPTAGGPVPIVVGCVLYDLAVGDPTVRPGPEHGYAACVSATDGVFETGAVGAGAGATVAKWQGPSHARPGGIGTATVRGDAGLVVSALIACNAWGAPRREGLERLAPAALAPWAAEPSTEPSTEPTTEPTTENAVIENTTVGLVVTNAALDKTSCLRVAQAGHDGLARALEPAHAAFDGDALLAAATGEVALPPPPAAPAAVEVVRWMAAAAVEAATRAAVPD